MRRREPRQRRRADRRRAPERRPPERDRERPRGRDGDRGRLDRVRLSPPAPTRRPGSSACPTRALSTPRTRASPPPAHRASGCSAWEPISTPSSARCCWTTCAPTPASPTSPSTRSRTRPATPPTGASPPTPSAPTPSRGSHASRTPACSTPATNRVVTAPCPAGKQLTGAGGDINTFNGQIVLDAVYSNAAATGSGFAAFEDDTGNPSPWSITSYGICANSVQRVVARRRAPTVFDVGCPTGLRPTGAGADLNGAFGWAILERMPSRRRDRPAAAARVRRARSSNSGAPGSSAATLSAPPRRAGLERLEAFSDQTDLLRASR